MSAEIDITVHAGEPWLIVLAAHEADGTTTMPLPSGTDVEFRVSDDDGVEIFTKTLGDGVAITDELGGIAETTITQNDQYIYEIVAGGVYWYAIRITKGEDISIQAEGRMRVEESIFATSVDPLVLDFHLRFPEFEEDDSVISVFIGDATRVVDGDGFWSEADRPVAIVYLAAHYLQLRLNAKTAHEAGGLETGPITMIRVEDRTVQYSDTQAQAAQARTGLSQTYYGQQYQAMARRYPRWLLRA